MDGFRKIRWQDGELLLEEARYTLDGGGVVPYGELPTDRFTLRKNRQIIGLYERFFAAHSFAPRRIFELGLYDGASIAFWHDVLEPEKVVGIDLIERGDSPYYRRWAAEREIGETAATYWGVDQRDKDRLWEIAAAEFGNEHLDLVIDDCSHIHGPTKASFEALFPLVRAGGWYVFEDWTWEMKSAYGKGSGSAFDNEVGLIGLVQQLIAAAGSPERGLVRSVVVNEPFVAVERGPATVFDPRRFALEEFVGRGPARQDRSFVFSTTTTATADEAFAEWTDATRLGQWWDWDRQSEKTVRLDARVGGSYEIVVDGEGRHEVVTGEFLEVDAPHRLRQTLTFSFGDDWFARAVVTILFRPQGDETQVIVGLMDVEFRTTLVPWWWEGRWQDRLARAHRADHAGVR